MNLAKKNRLDQLLVKKNISSSRENAKRLIMSGNVFVEGERVDKPGTMIKEDSDIVVKEKESSYVSRGGLKLEKALGEFELDLYGSTCLDVGASTGGFTHCLLLHGAKLVYAVDVGYGQLAWQLRQDKRVKVLERTNIRNIEREIFKPSPGLATVDLSFVSLTLVIPKLDEILSPPKTIVALIKPQFELERAKIGKKGVVKSPRFQEEAIKNVVSRAYENDFILKGLTYSPIKGPKGNIEYFVYFEKFQENSSRVNHYSKSEVDHIVNNIVSYAHRKLSIY